MNHSDEGADQDKRSKAKTQDPCHLFARCDKSMSRPSVSFGDTGKTLSRNAIYTPLEGYDQEEVEPSQYMTTRKTIPKSLQESSLFTFYQSVSYNFHYKIATASDPRNNGNRPSSLKDVEERIRQRAITLIGGGINSAGCTSNDTGKARKRKRKTIPWQEFDKD